QYNETASGTAIPVNDLGRWEIKTLNLMVRPDDPLALPCAYTITVYGAPEWEYDQVKAAGTNPPYDTWQAPITGLYKIECWGAEGGGGTNGRATPGKGGYSYGTIALVKDEELFVTVGGKGVNGSGGGGGGGGVNGGGTSGQPTGYHRRGGGGGGASDVRYQGTDLQQRIIVAGGGGGAGGTDSSWPRVTGGSHGGGGVRGNGGNGLNRYTSETIDNMLAAPGAAWNDAGDAHLYGTATGIGQTSGRRNYETPGGGGGGYYGGQARQTAVNSSGYAFGGGGGSSFINTGLLTLWGGEPGKRSGNGLIRISWLGYVVNQATQP
ncbi:MAG: hypothetical protein LBD22_03740, partial [Spirochaetaceae bacterium]|nr:hypothetical protein [Spirochaetaceae bacterium]